METEEFKTKKREKERHPGRVSTSHQAVKFLFLAHFPHCRMLSIGRPYEVSFCSQASPPQNMFKLTIKYSSPNDIFMNLKSNIALL